MYSKIFNMAFGTIFNKYIYLIKALFIYTLIAIFADYIHLQNVTLVEKELQPNSIFVIYLALILNYLVYISVAITTHRILILGETSVPTWGIYKPTKREGTFLVNAILIGLILIAISIPVFLLAMPFKSTGIIMGSILILFVFVIVFSRLSLVFPMVSIDKEATLKDSWNFTKNYKLLVFVTVILFPILFTLVFGVVYGIAIEFLNRITGLNLFFLTTILNIIITVFTVSALSATYKQIRIEHPEYFNLKDKKDSIVQEEESP